MHAFDFIMKTHNAIALVPLALSLTGLLAGCAARPPLAPATTTLTSAEAPNPPSSTSREPPIASPVSVDYHRQATRNADQILDGMHDEILACYTARVAQNERAHGFITFDIVIGPDGYVQSTEASGGALLGTTTMNCMSTLIERARFERPYGGGTLHVVVPFNLRRVGPGEIP
jgi:hypothetical protein